MAEQSSGQKKRIEWIDILRGLMMFFVVYGHMTISRNRLMFIYSFHMPIFFLISGMTYSFNREWNVARFTYKKFAGLILPYLVLNIYVAPVREWLERLGECKSQSFGDLLIGILLSNGDTGYKMGSNTAWFIPCLFLTTMMVFLIQVVLDRILERRGREHSDAMMTIAIIGIVAICHFAGLSTGSGGIWHYRGAIFSMVFYQAGYLLMKHIGKVSELVERAGVWMLAVAAVMIWAGYRLGQINGSVSIIRNRYRNLLLFYIVALIISLAMIMIVMYMCRSERVIKALKPIDTIGRNTLPYIAFQVPVMKLFWYYFPATFGTKLEPWCSILVLAVYFGFIPLSVLVDKIVPKRIPAIERKLFNEQNE